MHDIMHLIKIHASSGRLYQAITTTEGIRQWWTRDASIEPKVGGVGEFGFFGRRFVAKVVVEELSPVSRVRWKVSNAAWPGSDIEFNLKAEGNDATLVFAHHGSPRAPTKVMPARRRAGAYTSQPQTISGDWEGNAEPGRQRTVRLG
jgi:uncharacterized protein YndB with AHSA1/START domain